MISIGYEVDIYRFNLSTINQNRLWKKCNDFRCI